MKDLMNKFLEYKKSEGIKDKTLNRYKTCIKECLNIFQIEAPEQMENLNYVAIKKEWLNPLELGNNSKNIRIVAMKSFCEYLRATKEISCNPFEDVKRYAVQPKKEVVKADDVSVILDYIRNQYKNKNNFLNYRDLFLVNVLVETGIRNAEARSIKVDDIQQDGSIVVVGKYNKARMIKFNSKLMKMLEKYLAYREPVAKCEYLFTTKSGVPMNENTITDIAKKYSRAVGLEYTAHTFRKYFTENKINKGVPIELVAKALGHSSTQVTFKSYYHTDVDDVAKVFE